MTSPDVDRTCKTCGMEFTARYFLAAHYADVHNLDNSSIALVMGYALQSVGPLLFKARQEYERRREVSQ